jgi:hypothetical protein
MHANGIAHREEWKQMGYYHQIQNLAISNITAVVDPTTVIAYSQLSHYQ